MTILDRDFRIQGPRPKQRASGYRRGRNWKGGRRRDRSDCAGKTLQGHLGVYLVSWDGSVWLGVLLGLLHRRGSGVFGAGVSSGGVLPRPDRRSPDDVGQDEELHRAVHEPHFPAADEDDARSVILEQKGGQRRAAARHGPAAECAARPPAALAGPRPGSPIRGPRGPVRRARLLPVKSRPPLPSRRRLLPARASSSPVGPEEAGHPSPGSRKYPPDQDPLTNVRVRGWNSIPRAVS